MIENIDDVISLPWEKKSDDIGRLLLAPCSNNIRFKIRATRKQKEQKLHFVMDTLLSPTLSDSTTNAQQNVSEFLLTL